MRRITLEYEDGTVGVFEPQDDGTWHQRFPGLITATGYDQAQVMEVLTNAVTKQMKA